MKAYVINLAHATERWEIIKKHLQGLSISYARIEGVYGKELPMPLQNYNERKYKILHGKTTNTGELGCYFSHLKALKDFLNSSDSHALILEDDIEPPSNIMNLIDRALSYYKYWNLLRLTSFTPGEHLAFAEIGDCYNLSYNLKVLKNTGAYVIDRWAAQCLLQKMQPMFLPYDVALDREWHYGFRTACISPLPIRLNMDLPGQIPPARKIRFYRTTTFHLFHLLTHIERRWYRRRFYNETTREIKSK